MLIIGSLIYAYTFGTNFPYEKVMMTCHDINASKHLVELIQLIKILSGYNFPMKRELKGWLTNLCFYTGGIND